MTIAVLALTFVPAPDFPAPFLGDWKGEMAWSKPGDASPQSVPMRLKIAKTDQADVYTYLLVYGADKKDTRPYTLRPKDAKSGHWVIDEGGGIVLDVYWTGDSLIGVFSVGTNTIHSRLRIEGRTLVSEMTTTETAPLNEGPQVTTRRVRSLQRAVLRRS